MTSAKEKLLAMLKARQAGLNAKQIKPTVADTESQVLSFGQQRFWFFNQYVGANAVYNMVSACQLPAATKPAVLAQAIAALTSRHDVLRSRYVEVAGQPVVQLAATGPSLQYDQVADEGALIALCRAEQLHVVDLKGDPLCRFRLISLNYTPGYALLINLHHSIADGQSQRILLHELSVLYQACAQGLPSPLPPLAIQYGDYAAWQRDYLQGDRLTQLLSYWQTQLAGLQPLIRLPTDHARPRRQSFNGAVLPVSFDHDLSLRLSNFASSQGTTLYLVLLTAYAILLGRYAGQDDIAIGTSVANRNSQEIEGLIGFFVNLLVMRIDLKGHPDFLTLLERNRRLSANNFAHAELPFEKLVEEVNPGRDNGSHSPLFQVMFVLQETAPAQEATTDLLGIAPLQLSVDPGEITGLTARFDLTLNLQQSAVGIVGVVEFNSDLFERATVATMLEHYTKLLEAILAQPRRAICQYSFITERERVRLLEQFVPAASAYPSGQCVHQIFAQQVALYPDAVALIAGEEQLSYLELDQQANRLAHYLIAQGLQPETRVAVYLERSLEMIVALLAILKAGGAYVPLDLATPAARLHYILQDSAAGLVLSRRQFSRDLPAGTARLVLLDDEHSQRVIADQPATSPLTAVGAANLCYIIYTSGSTGNPKGVMVSHDNLADFLHHSVAEFLPPHISGAVVSTPLVFDATVGSLWVPLMAGRFAELLPEGALALDQLGDYLTDEDCHYLFKVTPSHLEAVSAKGFVRCSPAARHVIVVAGEPLSPETLRIWSEDVLPNALLINEYGPTETTVGATIYPVSEQRKVSRQPPGQGSVPIGRALGKTELYVLNDAMSLQSLGAVGELYIGGLGVARGYTAARLTAERFVPHPFAKTAGERLYRTGDLVRFQDDGNLQFLGRVDHQVKIRGYRIELAEIEAVLNAHPAVNAAVVMTKADLAGSQQLIAYVATERAAVSTDTLRAFVAEQLPQYMVPALFMLLDAFTLNVNGKIDRHALPAPEFGNDSYSAVETATEQLLAGIWCQLLGCERAGRTDHFFKLGGHSLLTTRLVSAIRQVFGVELTIRMLFDHPLLCAQAELIEQQLAADLPEQGAPVCLSAAERSGPLPLSFAQQRMWFLNQYMGANAVYNIPLALRLTGTVDATALIQALGELERRHQSLRTRFVVSSHEAMQLIDAEPCAVEEELLDFASELLVVVQQERGYCFDLSQHKPYRVRLLRDRCDEQALALLLTMHHSISDGWSVEILLRELTVLYQAFCAGEPSPLAPLPLQYADYAVWQRGMQQGPRLAHQLSYWRSALDGLPALLQLPYDKPRPALPGYAGNTLRFDLPPALVQQLQLFSRQHDVTEFMTLLAAFSVLLGRYSGMDDIAVGIPTANRSHGEVEGLIGFFVNTLVLRTQLQDKPDFAALVARTRHQVLQALSMQDVPFELLVDELVPERTPSHSPLFQVAFSLQSQAVAAMPTVTPVFADLAATLPHSATAAVARFDLAVNLYQAGVTIKGGIEYSTDLFEHDTIRQLSQHYLQLLQLLLDAPQLAVQSHQLPGTDCDAAVTKLSNTPLQRLLSPKALQLAAVLAEQGVGFGSVVAVSVQDQTQRSAALCAVVLVGACAVFVDPQAPRLRQDFVLADSEARYIVSDAAWPAPALVVIRFDQLPAADVAAGRTVDDAQWCCQLSGDRLACLVYPLLPGLDPVALNVEQLNALFGAETVADSLFCGVWSEPLFNGGQPPLQLLRQLKTDGVVVAQPAIASARVYCAELQPVPDGVYGRLYVGGELVSHSVWRQGAVVSKPRHQLLADSALLGRLRADGNWQLKLPSPAGLSGRALLGCTERLRQLPAVTAAAVVRRVVGTQSQLAAYVVSEQSAHALQLALTRQPLAWLPDSVTAVPQLPLDATGRFAAELLPAQAVSASQHVAPRNETERKLLLIWQQKLDVDPLSIDDNYFSLGGDSIRSIALVAEAKAQGLACSVKDLFAYPTVALLAARIEQQQTAATLDWDIAPFALLDAAELDLLESHYGLAALQDAYPLSQLQQGMVLHAMQAASLGLYQNLQLYYFADQWDPVLFAEAFEFVLHKHPVLKSKCLLLGKRPLQVVPVQAAVPLQVMDWTAQSEAQSRLAIEQWMAAEQSQGLDISTGWWRTTIHLLPDGGFVFGIFVHHAMWDGWSLESFATEMYARYQQRRQGVLLQQSQPLPGYSRFIALEQAALCSEAQQQYWQHSTATGVVPWWAGRPKAGRRLVQCDITTAQSADLSRAARQFGIAEKSLWSSIYLVLLNLLNGADATLGCVLNQGRPEIPDGDQIIGLFLNALPIAVPMAGRSWRQYAQAVDQQLTEQLDYRHYPLAAIQQQSGLDLSAAVFNYTHWHVYQTGIDGERPQQQPQKVAGFAETNYLLMFSVEKVEPQTGFKAYVSLDSAAFDEAQAERVNGYVQQIIRQFCHAPANRTSTAALLSAQEFQLVRSGLCGPKRQYPHQLCLHQLFEAQAEQRGEAVALRCDERSISYRELNRTANQLAHWLIAQGVTPEVRVALVMPRSIELICAMLAVLKAGGVYLAIPLEAPAARQQYMLADADIQLVLQQLPAVQDQSVDNPAVDVHPVHPAYLIYTSGSTGKPKGVLGLHRSVVNRLYWLAGDIGVGPTDVLCQKTSVGFVDHAAEIFQALCFGAELVIVDSDMLRQPEQFNALLNRYAVTQLTLVPSLLTMLLLSAQMQVPTLRALFCSGEAMLADKLSGFASSFPQATLYNIYGSTEVGADVSCAKVDIYSGQVPIGRIIDNNDAMVLNADGEPVPAGVPGQLYIGGDGLARGYLARPAQTAAAFVPNPFGPAGSRWYGTGDLVLFRQDGQLEYLGRLDQQVKLRGIRIEPAEVEAQLLQHPAVTDAVVQLRNSPAGEPQLVAWVVSQQQDKVQLCDELKLAARAALPDYMVPTAFAVLTALPLNTSGKVDRVALPVDQFLSRLYVAPQGQSETALAALWADLLGVATVGRQDNFFELGGHSLLLTQLMTRIREQFVVKVGLAQLFASQRLDQQALLLESERPSVDIMRLTPMPADAPALLSYAQLRLFFLHELLGPNAIYNMPLALRLAADTDLEALQRSLLALQQRHESLRTRFIEQNAQVIQVIEAVPAAIPLEQLATVAELKAAWQAERRYCFDLRSDVLCRIRLLQVQSKDYALLLTLHHSVSDGWSVSLLLKELALLYQAFAAGQTAALPPLSLQYRDFAYWQRQYLQQGVLATQLDYWRQQLAALPPSLDLPTDWPRPAQQTYRGATAPLSLSAALVESLQLLALNHDATLFMVLQAAWAVLLGRYAGQQDVVVGTPVAGRNHQATEQLVGFFANTLVLRNDLSGPLNFVALLARTRDMMRQAYAHQDVPFERLVDAIAPERDLSRSPLFQVMLVLQNVPMPDEELSKLATPLSFADEGQGIARFELTLTMQPGQDGLTGQLEYNCDLFSAGRIDKMLIHFVRLLTAVVQTPMQLLSQLTLLDDMEQAQQTEQWNATSVDFPTELTLNLWFEQQTAQTPDAIALIDGDRRWSFRQLDQRSNQVAHALLARGVGADTAVGLWLERSAEMVIGLWGILKAGGCYVPLEPAYPVGRLRYMLSNSGARIVLSAALGASERPQLPSGVQLQYMEDIGDEWPQTRLQPANTAGNLAYILYTSGSTGQPKGVAVSHQAVVNRIHWMKTRLAMGPADRVLQKTPFSFDVAGVEFFSSLAGSTLVIAKPGGHQDASYLAALIEMEAISLVHFVPSMLNAFLNAEGWQQCRSVRAVLCSGEALLPALQQQFFGMAGTAELLNLYGPTETTIDVTCWSCLRDNDSVAIGKPIDNIRCYVTDEQLQLLPVGAVGELLIGGVGLARGYINQAALTAARFIPDPFAVAPGGRLYRTGDLVRLRADGNIDYLGRADHQVKIRGLRIELAEIETLLCSHPLVKEAVVLALQQRLIAYLCPVQAVPDLLASVGSLLQAQLPGYMIPQQFVLLEVMPLTSSGKIDRKGLPQPAAELQSDSYRAAQNELQAALVQLWQQVLAVQPVGIDDNFFAKGGDSILSIELVSKARRQGLYLNVQQIFQYPTIAQLAAQAGLQHQQIEQDESQGVMPLLPIHHWFGEQQTSRPGQFHQSRLLQTPPDVDVSFIRQWVTMLYQRHDALRLSYQQTAAGWQGHFVPFAAQLLDETVSEHRFDTDFACQLMQLGSQLKAAVALSDGPLLRAAYCYDTAHSNGYLLLIFHHLIIDGVSWRVLLADLQTAYQQHRQGKMLTPAPKTTSYQHWAQTLLAYAQSTKLQQQRDFWLRQLAQPQSLFTGRVGRACHAQAEHLLLSLDAELSRQLLTDCSISYRTQVQDLLLTALLRAVARLTGERSLRVDLESHGRETAQFAALDLTETVGWFTSLYPLYLQLDTADLGSQIKSLKEQLRAVPDRGLGYGVLRYLAADPQLQQLAAQRPAAVLFNYLGQFEGQGGQPDTFATAALAHGPDVDPDRERSHPLSFNGLVTGGQLQFVLGFNASQLPRDDITQLGQWFISELEQIVLHCRDRQVRGYTPSDFPLARLEQQQLDLWQQQLPALEDVYPATGMQQGMIFHSRIDASKEAYGTQIHLDFGGTFDAVAFKAVWQLIVQRHSLFRTAFAETADGQMLQLVYANVELSWCEQDWRQLSAAEQETRFYQHRKAVKAQGFDFISAPLMRMSLIRLADQHYRWLWTHHHSLLDGWSLPLVFDDMLRGYHAQSLQRSADLAPVMPYRHYVAWLVEQDSAAAQAYWRQYLAGLAGPFQLSIANSDSGSIEQGQREKRLVLPNTSSQGLQRQARRHGVTINAMLQAGWAYLLHRYSGETDVLYGQTVSGRSSDVAGIGQMVGLFINTLPARVRFDRQLTVATLLQRIHQAQVEREQYGYLPLIDIQAAAALPPGQQLFDSLLVFENYPISEAVRQAAEHKADDSQLQVIGMGNTQGTEYGLHLIIQPGETLTIDLVYLTAAYSDSIAAQLLEHFAVILQALSLGEVQSVAALPYLLPVELQPVVNQTSYAYPQTSCLHQLFEAQARETPEAVAVVYQQESLSYRQLNDRANQLAHYLRTLGVGPEVAVGICIERCSALLVGLLAVLKAGGCYVPLDPSYPEDRLAGLMAQSDCRLVLSDSGLISELTVLGTVRVVPLDEQMLARLVAQCPVQDLTVDETSLCVDHTAYVIFTSGSTGQPKGVQVPHRALVNYLYNSAAPLLSATAGAVVSTSLNFDATVTSLFAPLLRGACVRLLPQGHAELTALQHLLLHSEQDWLFKLTPVHLELMVQMASPQCNASNNHVLVIGGDQFNAELLRRWQLRLPNATFINEYGPTETVVGCSAFRVDRAHPWHGRRSTVPIGTPLANTRFYVVDKDLNLLPTGAVGELLIGGDCVARGYLKRGAATAEHFVPDCFGGTGGRLYRSGDLVQWLPDGQLVYQGRADQQLKIRGVRIEPAEIETALRAHPQVRDVVVVARQLASAGTQLVAYVVLWQQQPAGETAIAETDFALVHALRSHCLQQLPGHLRPGIFVPLPQLPVTHNGKIDKAALPMPLLAMQQTEYVAPQNDEEVRLQQFWQQLLQVQQIGIHDSFWALGGQSLLALRLINLIRDSFAVELPLKDIFDYQTIAAQARHIAELHTAAMLAGTAAQFADDENIEQGSL
ncbi:hypothetical protein A5320_18300 [Rheinheimera sp. SA_1]|uniref:non-ribosomal peptide synthetase n=1 Tax=Rheinheimera sp. SA_1 TaxID=1827365 RepID=UPI0007FC6454|nr:non-ribosomal peptide synthetase [Rheinheimera sp. SA_1]OBP13499.1 hypothetical protein A5320_18300 [Rheinheimera sp. SA_1]